MAIGAYIDTHISELYESEFAQLWYAGVGRLGLKE